MMDQHQTALVSLLLGSFPTFSSGDAQAALAAYEVVLNQADERDVQPGIFLLINGQYPGHDGRFAPTSAQLAGAVRVCRDRRLESEARSRPPELPAPDRRLSPEERQRMADLAERTVRALRTPDRQADIEAERRRHEGWARTNERFQPDMSPEVVRKRLGFTVGDPDGDVDVA